MSDAIVQALVRSRRRELAADAARCRAVRRERPVSAPHADAPPRDAALTTHGALRDYLTAM